MIKAAIYDLDDTMVNSLPLHLAANDALLAEYGHKVADIPPDLKASFLGRRIKDILKKTIEVFKIDVDLDAFYKKREKIFLKIAEEKLEALPGLIESLDSFQKNGFRIALATSANKDYLDLVLNKFNVGKYFKVIVSGDDVKIGKPDPETYQAAAEKLKLKPEECLVLEDATAGIASAITAGCRCIAIKNNYTPPQDLSKADLVVNSLLEIDLKIIKAIS